MCRILKLDTDEAEGSDGSGRLRTTGHLQFSPAWRNAAGAAAKSAGRSRHRAEPLD